MIDSFGPRPRVRLKSVRSDAKGAELADAPDLGSGSRKAMGVRLPPFAPFDSTSPAARLRSWQAESPSGVQIEWCPERAERVEGPVLTTPATPIIPDEN